MAPLAPHISLAAVGWICDIHIPDNVKPNTFLVFCDFYVPKVKGGEVTIPVLCYFDNGEVPPAGSHVTISGPVWMPPGTDSWIEAESFEVLTDDPNTVLNLPTPSVTAIGTVATLIERDIHLDVGAYSRDKRAMITYQIIVTVPDNTRRANMKLPQTGANVAICGVLTYIGVHEEFGVPQIEMESMVFLPQTDFMRRGEVGTNGGRAKRPLVLDKFPDGLDIGTPMKKVKSGPPEAFTEEELRGGSSSQGSSSSPSQASMSSSSTPSVSGSSRTTRSSSSQSSVSDPPSPSKKTNKAVKGNMGRSSA